MAEQIVNLPDIGEGVTEGEMVKWLVNVGDTVEADQPIAEIMTDKATVEVPTPYAGVVKELKANEGDVVPIETPLLVLDAEGATAAPKKEAAKPAAPAPTAPAAPAQAPAPAPVAHANGATGGMDVYPPVADSRVLASPSSRRLARDLNVDINVVKGTGLSGRVTRDDVLQAKSQGAFAPTANGATSQTPSTITPMAPGSIPKPAYQGPAGAIEEREPLRGIRRKIAHNMQMYKQIIPHFTLMDEANVTDLVKTRNEAKISADSLGIKITYLPFVMKALIATCREFPMFNASIDDANEEIVYKKYFNIGFAADTPNGLVVPVIKDADRKTILQISQEIMDLAGRAREGKLKPEEMKGATITITNIGSVGGTYATPIINHPEVAILGMYKIIDKPVYIDGKFKHAKVMNFSMTADHRLIDGAVAANFLSGFIKRIQHPSNLMLDMI
ncbi:MAG: pyruvate dehydrogenase [Bdellovibrionaceae bacterium]|nr:pyruvate dehydrogenase [Pseudobdellovibrionaceae bacterium]|tara:strand:+ start:135234 stop:136568 length:1335 start_codon:yes stop_codon:yes gene_type:complete